MVCRDSKFFVATKFLSIVLLCVATEFLTVALVCCCERLFLCHRLIFFAPGHWLNCLKQHWSLCRDILSWLVSCLFHFLLRHKTSLSRQKSLTQQFSLLRQGFLPCFLYCRFSVATVVVSVATEFTSASCCVCRD